MKQFALQARYLELEWKNIENYSDRLYALLGLMAGRICLTKQKDEIDCKSLTNLHQIIYRVCFRNMLFLFRYKL